jgi:hypothetical protein
MHGVLRLFLLIFALFCGAGQGIPFPCSYTAVPINGNRLPQIGRRGGHCLEGWLALRLRGGSEASGSVADGVGINKAGERDDGKFGGGERIEEMGKDDEDGDDEDDEEEDDDSDSEMNEEDSADLDGRVDSTNRGAQGESPWSEGDSFDDTSISELSSGDRERMSVLSRSTSDRASRRDPPQYIPGIGAGARVGGGERRPPGYQRANLKIGVVLEGKVKDDDESFADLEADKYTEMEVEDDDATRHDRGGSSTDDDEDCDDDDDDDDVSGGGVTGDGVLLARDEDEDAMLEGKVASGLHVYEGFVPRDDDDNYDDEYYHGDANALRAADQRYAQPLVAEEAVGVPLHAEFSSAGGACVDGQDGVVSAVRDVPSIRASGKRGRDIESEEEEEDEDGVGDDDDLRGSGALDEDENGFRDMGVGMVKTYDIQDAKSTNETEGIKSTGTSQWTRALPDSDERHRKQYAGVQGDPANVRDSEKKMRDGDSEGRVEEGGDNNDAGHDDAREIRRRLHKFWDTATPVNGVPFQNGVAIANFSPRFIDDDDDDDANVKNAETSGDGGGGRARPCGDGAVANMSQPRWSESTNIEVEPGETKQAMLDSGLCRAVEVGNALEVQHSIRMGASVGAGFLGVPIVQFAAEHCEGDVLCLLASIGADLQCRSGVDETVLHAVARKGLQAMVSLVVELGGRPNWRDDGGSTPMHLAAIHGHALVVSDLVDLGGDINARDRLGRTPLHEAAYNCKHEAVRTLVRKGANGAAMDVDGKSAYTAFLSSPFRKKRSDGNTVMYMLLSGSMHSPAALSPKPRGRLDL